MDGAKRLALLPPFRPPATSGTGSTRRNRRFFSFHLLNSSGYQILESAADWRVLIPRLPASCYTTAITVQLSNRPLRRPKRLDHLSNGNEKLQETKYSRTKHSRGWLIKQTTEKLNRLSRSLALPHSKLQYEKRSGWRGRRYGQVSGGIRRPDRNDPAVRPYAHPAPCTYLPCTPTNASTHQRIT